jgi:hypothetical protein
MVATFEIRTQPHPTMKPGFSVRSSALLSMAALTCSMAAAVAPDIAPPVKRTTAVATAQALRAKANPTPATLDLPSPFNPDDSGVEKKAPVSADLRAADSDALTLQKLANEMPAGARMIHDGKTVLAVGRHQLELGAVFVASLDNKLHELEVTEITSTTFTVRYRGIEYTRTLRK